MRHTILLLTAWAWAMTAFAQVAVIHQNTTEVECTGASSATVRYTLVMTVNDKRGEDLCNWVQHCEKGSFELKSFKGTITEGNGKVTKVKKGDLRQSEYSENLADDDYTYYYLPRTSSYPMQIAYEWEMTYSTLLIYPKFFPIEHYDVRVDSARYRIITTDANTLRYKAFNFEPEVRTYDMKGGKHVTEIALANLPVLERFDDGLPFNQRAPHVYFAPTQCTYRGSRCDMNDWQSYGQWVYDLLKGRDRLPKELEQKIHALTDTCTSDKSKVGVIRRWMGETTRYVNIALGIGGFQPRSTEEVYKTGIGDCKALSNYFCSMLHALGIPARYTLIGDRDLLDDMPTFQQLNHVIVQVPLPHDTLWVECTNARYPFDYCPSDHRGHEVILITEQGGTLAKIPERVDEETIENERIEVTISADGDADITLTRHCEGEAFESNLRRMEMRNDDLRENVISRMHLPHPTVKALAITPNDKTADLHMEASSIGWARMSGNRLFVPVSLYPSKLQKKDKPHTVDLRGMGFVQRDTLTLLLPDGFEVESLPASQTIESDFGRYEMQLQQEGQRIIITTTCHIKSGVYAPEKYADWMTFRQQMANLNRKNVAIIKGN